MLYITSYCSKSPSITEAVKAFAELGFTNIELTGGTIYDNYCENELWKLKEKYQLHFLLHNFFPPQKNSFVLNLATRDHEVRSLTVNLIEQAIALTQKMSGNLYGIHAGYLYDFAPQKGKDGLFVIKKGGTNSRDHFYETLSHIGDTILPKGFKLAIENAFPAYGENSYSFLTTPEDIFYFMQFCERYPDIGILLDFGHLNVASYYCGFDKRPFLDKLFSDYPHKIFEVHMSQNNGVRDAHEISLKDSFEIRFVLEHFHFFQNIPIVLEWHQELSNAVFHDYQEIKSFLNL